MTHTPILRVIDEKDSPGMWIIQRCKECDVEISRHEFDASRGAPVGDDALHFGREDGYAWLKHCAEGQA
jgi:hypothetical protein